MSEDDTVNVLAVAPLRLREAREAAGLHIAALAAALKVPVKKLEALEAGRYDELPDMTFARALASSACRQLKIDPAAVLEQIPQAHRPQLGDSPQTINEPFKGAGGAVTFSPAGWLARPAVLAAIALLLGALVLVFLPARETADDPVEQADAVMPPGAAGAEVAPAGPAATADAVAEPVANAVTAEPPVNAAATGAPVTDTLATPASVAPPATSPPVPAAAGAAAVTAAVGQPAPASGRLLSITATGDSWVEVVNGSKEVVVQRMLKAGDVLDFSAAPPYAVVIGRADAAKVTVRGQPLDITPYARNSVARFEVK